MDPILSHFKAPEIQTPPRPVEHTAAQQTANTNNQNRSPKTHTPTERKVEPGVISQLSPACLNSLEQISRSTDPLLIPARELKILLRAIDTLILWNDGYGVQSGFLEANLKPPHHVQFYRTYYHSCAHCARVRGIASTFLSCAVIV